MEIATREVRKKITLNYEDGSTKKVHMFKYYTGSDEAPKIRWKIVDYKTHDGTIDKNRSYDSKLIIDKYEDYDNEYTKKETEMLTIIHYNNNSTKNTKYWEIENVLMKSRIRQTINEMENPGDSIDKYKTSQIVSFDLLKKNGKYECCTYSSPKN